MIIEGDFEVIWTVTAYVVDKSGKISERVKRYEGVEAPIEKICQRLQKHLDLVLSHGLIKTYEIFVENEVKTLTFSQKYVILSLKPKKGGE